MTEILQERKAGEKILDAFAIAGVAIGSQYVMSPLVGTGNFISGASKLAIGLGASFLGKGKVAEYAGAGFLIDGSMDIVNSIVNGTIMKTSSASASNTLVI